jgi:hypothetical protein
MNTRWETQSRDYGTTYFSKFYAETTQYEDSAGLAIDAQHSQSDDCYVERNSIEIEFRTREDVNNLIALLMEVRNKLPQEVIKDNNQLTCPVCGKPASGIDCLHCGEQIAI